MGSLAGAFQSVRIRRYDVKDIATDRKITTSLDCSNSSDGRVTRPVIAMKKKRTFYIPQ